MDDGLKKVIGPPKELTLNERSLWWLSNPDELEMALVLGIISEEEKERIEYKSKDVDLAHEIINTKKGDRFNHEEKSRLFSALTGIDYMVHEKKKGPKPKDKLYIEVANAIEGLSGREANRKAREVAGNRYHDNTNKLMSKAREAKAKYDEIGIRIIAEMKRILPLKEHFDDLPEVDKMRLSLLVVLAEMLGEDLDREEAILNLLVS